MSTLIPTGAEPVAEALYKSYIIPAFGINGVTVTVEAIIALKEAFDDSFVKAFPTIYAEVQDDFTEEEFEVLCKGICSVYDVTATSVQKQYNTFIGK